MMHSQQTRVTVHALDNMRISKPQIARMLGIGVGTVYRWLDPEIKERDRQNSLRWKASHPEEARAHCYGHCARCGRTNQHQSTLCGLCLAQHQEERRLAIECLVRGKASSARIAEILGFKDAQVASSAVQRLRAEGRHLPWRRPFKAKTSDGGSTLLPDRGPAVLGVLVRPERSLKPTGRAQRVDRGKMVGA